MAATLLDEVTRLADKLSAEEQLSLAEHLAHRLRQQNQTGASPTADLNRKPQDLYGIWKDHFPPDVDIDAMLHEIRREWETEWPEVFNP